MRALKYSADKTATKLKNLRVSQEKSNGRRRSFSGERRSIPKQMYLSKKKCFSKK